MVAKKPIDYVVLQRAGIIGCTQEEAAFMLGISLTAFKRHLSDDTRFKETWGDVEVGHRASLKRLQWRWAQGLDAEGRPMAGAAGAAVAMTIHLSKHRLGETEKSLVEMNMRGTLEITGRNAAEVLLEGIDPHRLTLPENIELSRLCRLIDEKGNPALPSRERHRLLVLIDKGIPEQSVEPDEDAEVLLLPPPGAYAPLPA
jgi:hypothetical protein